MSYDTIVLRRDNGIAELQLNRPDSLNSLSIPMFREMLDAVQLVAADPAVRALLITAAGRGFCAGGDLAGMIGQMTSADPQTGTPVGEMMGKNMEQVVNPVVLALTELPIPVICAVNGVAAGGGSSLALCCDIVFAARSARFVQSFVKVGLVPDMGGTWLLPRNLGRGRAMALSMLAQGIDAETAQAWGLIWQCVDDGELLATARATAADLARQPTRTLGLIKRAINTSHRHTLGEQLDVERDMQARAADTDDFREGVSAFLARRAPVFSGH